MFYHKNPIALRRYWNSLSDMVLKLVKYDANLSWRLVTIGLLFVIIIGCSNEQKSVEGLDSNVLKSEKYKERKRKQYLEYIAMIDTTYTCKMIRNYPDSLVLGGDIRYRELLNGADSCVLEIIDTLFYDYTNTGKEEYMVIIDSICKYSDGYISEALQINFDSLFLKTPVNLIRYLSSKKNDSITNRFLIWHFELINTDKQYADEKREIKRIVDSCAVILTKQESIWLKSIIKKAKFHLE